MLKPFVSLALLSLVLTACQGQTQSGSSDLVGVSARPNLFTASREVQLRAAVIRNSGDILPVARTELTITPYNREQVRDQVIARNQPGPEPDMDDPEFAEQHCFSSSCINLPDVTAWSHAHERWLARAEQGLQAAYAQAEQQSGRQTQRVTTSLSGEAAVTLQEGQWYVQGRYSLNSGRSVINWNDVPLIVNSKITMLELSNDNGSVSNLSS